MTGTSNIRSIVASPVKPQWRSAPPCSTPRRAFRQALPSHVQLVGLPRSPAMPDAQQWDALAARQQPLWDVPAAAGPPRLDHLHVGQHGPSEGSDAQLLVMSPMSLAVPNDFRSGQ